MPMATVARMKRVLERASSAQGRLDDVDVIVSAAITFVAVTTNSW